MPFATSPDGLRLRYRTLGEPQRPPLLLVMGLGLSSDGWDALPEKLAARFHVVIYDNRNTGESDRTRKPFSMATLANDAVAVLDAAGLLRAHVFGISMGGMIAQELALRHPQRLKRLALGCTFDSWLGSKKGHPSVARDLVSIVLSSPGKADPQRLGRVLVSKEFMESAGAKEAFVRWRANADKGRAAKGALLQLLAVVGHTTRRRLGRIEAPTLVISGDADRIVPVENARRLAEAIPHARLVLLKGAGHVFPLEREAETVGALEEHFLAEGAA